MLQHESHGAMENWAQKLCAPCAPNGAQMGHKIGHKFGAQIWGTELILKSIKIIYSTSFLVYVPQMGYKNYVSHVSMYPKWGTRLGFNIGCRDEFDI